jgi:hypothetical protein
MRLSCLILVVFLAFSACKKEDNGKSKHFRIITVDNHTNGISSGGTRILYDGKDIWRISSYNHSGDSSRIEYSYPEDNKAIESYYVFNGFSWSMSKKIEYQYQGDHISQIIEYSDFNPHTGAFDPYIKISLQYHNDDLVEELMYSYYHNFWNENAKLTYTYSGGNLTQTMMYNKIAGIWDIAGKEEVTYDGDNLDIIFEYDYQQGTYFEIWKYEFSYEADRIIATDVYEKADEDKWSHKYRNEYIYDGDGNLASESIIESGNTDKSDFIYENKEGNLGQFIYRGGGAAGIVLPMPTKVTSKSFEEVEKNITTIKD